MVSDCCCPHAIAIHLGKENVSSVLLLMYTLYYEVCYDFSFIRGKRRRGIIVVILVIGESGDVTLGFAYNLICGIYN